ncbi:MAG: tyrosine-type recombinase/integrase, partial [Verrucomicrobiota bacterium]
LSDISSSLIEDWMRDRYPNPATQRSNLRNLSALFSWAVEERFLAENPCNEVRPDELEKKRGGVEFLTVEECRILLEACAEEDLRLLPFFAISMFTGARPSEVDRLTFADIHEERHVVKGIQFAELVMNETKDTRTNVANRKRRVVDLPENALSWLELASPTYEAADRISPCKNYRNRFDRIKKRLGRWPSDALRHTFASYHYATYRDEAWLQALLGHESAQTLHNHYRGVARPAMAERFWNLRPNT